MFKLVVLFAFVAVAAAKSSGAEVQFIAHSYVAPAPLSYVASAPLVAQTYVVPAAVSSTYREDIFSKPASTVEEKPVVVEAKTAVVEPVTEATTEEIATEEVEIATVKAEPLVAKAVEAPAAVSSTYREDIISKPAILAYSVPVVHNTISYAAPVAYHAVPAYHPW